MRRDTAWRRALIGVQGTLAISAVYGSAGLVLQLDGFSMPTRWLHPLPLDSWLLPGLALLVGVALPLGAAAVAEARHDPRGSALSWGAAALLGLWLLVQVLVIGVRAPVQVMTLCLAAVLVVLTARVSGVRR